MVVPKIGAQYVIRKIADEVMAPPAKPAEEPVEQASSGSPPSAVKEAPDPFDGIVISDEQGENIGTARRLRSVAVYMVSDTHGNLEKELEECVLDDESRRYFARDDRGKIVGLIYAPHPDRMPRRAEAFRADDI